MTVQDYFEEEKILLASQRNNYFENLRNCLRYHYTTSIETVKSILDSKCIRLMHYSAQNDSSEGILLLEKLKGLIPKYDEIFKLLTSNLYLCSFSLFGNLLSQWCRYGDVNIGFDFEAMKNDCYFIKDQAGMHHDTSGTRFVECTYISDEDKTFSNALEEIKNQIKNIDYSNLPSQQYVYLLVGSICFSFKHSGFKEENEYRIYTYLWKRSSFSIQGKKYIEFIFEPNKVKRIVLGPSKQQADNIKIINDFLKGKEEYSHIQVVKSTIPYIERNYSIY